MRPGSGAIVWTSSGWPRFGAGLVEAYVFLISGLVQGVGFRWFAEREASRRQVRGYVRNLPDGRVEVLAQADSATLEGYLEKLRQGPRGARVASIERSPAPVDTTLDSFQVRY